jgi:hypothetical protein
MTTKLCPAVEEIIHDFIDNSTSEDDKYVQGIKKGATLQAEYDKKTMVSKKKIEEWFVNFFGDDAKVQLEYLGIEQEEKEK